MSKSENSFLSTVYGSKNCNYNLTKKLNHYERTKAQVYATGNKWAIENFNATHN